MLQMCTHTCPQAHTHTCTWTTVKRFINKGEELNRRLKERVRACIKPLEKANRAAGGISALAFYGAQS